MNDLKVAIVYRVIQEWRKPVFSRLSDLFTVKVFYGCDFPGTKVVSGLGPYSFPAHKMLSLPIAVKRPSGNMLIPVSFGLFFQLIRFRPDVVVCEGASNFINNLFVFAYCRLFGKSMIQWGLGAIKDKKVSFVRRGLNFLIQPIERRADAIISYSSFGARYYRELGVGSERIFVAVNVVDTEKRLQEVRSYYANSFRAHRESFRVFSIGAIEPNKRLDKLIRAIKFLITQGYEVELHVVGDGSWKNRMQELCVDLGISQFVYFYGEKKGPIADIACEMDVFVMPGLGGLAISDMLCHGLPVICGVGDGCEMDLIDGRNGVILETMTEESIAAKLEEFILSPEQVEAMKHHAEKTIRKFNIQNYVNTIAEAIGYGLSKNA